MSTDVRDEWIDVATETSGEHDSDADLLDSLLREGLLSITAVETSDVVSTDVPLDGPLVSIGEEIIATSPVRFRHVAVFLFYLFRSAASLRCLTLKSIVRRVYRRRSATIAAGYMFDLSRVSALVDVFRSVRPYFFIARDHCLLHALTLVDFLAHYGEYPIWVFGVATDPWTAHSWVQQGNFLLDSNPEKVCSLNPILAI